METLYYMGNVINDLGRPYAIITIYEENDKVITEYTAQIVRQQSLII